MSASLTQLSALSGVQVVGTSPLADLQTPINPNSVSFEAIKNDLVRWALNKPKGVAWTDWFATDDGTIIAEWIAGLATFRKLAEIMRLRESSLDFAQLESSIFELAFNRGLLVSPAAAPILLLNLSQPHGVATAVNLGDLVGNQGTYQLFSLEGKTLLPTDTLRVAVGHKNVFSPAFSTLGQFKMFQFPLQDRYVAAELESFMAGNKAVPLVSEPNNLGGFQNTFVLRRVVPNQVRVYVGNGTMGWYDPSTPSITYTCLSYGADIDASLAYTPQIALNAKLAAFEHVQAPSYDPDKETLRAIARYYPIDGRIVQDGDYESVIRKYFGGIVSDVYAYNDDPNEQVYLIANKAYGFDDPQRRAEQLAAITALVDSKRGLGMQVFYTVFPSNAGKTFVLDFKVPEGSYSYSLQQQVNDITAGQLHRFARAGVTLRAVDFAGQLSAYFGVPFTPSDRDAGLTMTATDFMSSFTINLA